MENRQKGNKTMFYVGIVLAIISAVLLLGNFLGKNILPIYLGGIGVVLIASSEFRLMK